MILLDHMMPDMDGVETLHRLRSDNANLNRNTVVVALTANAVAGCREMYLEYGFDDSRLEKIWTSLTDPRDKIIFKALSMGYTQKEIEQEYGIPQSTVCYRKNILRNFAKV